jgi:hypothetical protein
MLEIIQRFFLFFITPFSAILFIFLTFFRKRIKRAKEIQKRKKRLEKLKAPFKNLKNPFSKNKKY